MRTFLILASLVLSQAAHAQVACPLGPKDDHLTIQRVMINFGKYTSNADSLVSQGTATPEQLAQAAADLGIAGACAQAVVDGTSDDLLPAGARKLSGAQRDALIADFKQTMSKFEDALADYAKALTAGDLAQAKVCKQNVNDIADEAHSKF